MSATQSDLMRLVHRAALLGERVGERRFQEEAGVGRATYLVLRTVAESAGSLPSQQALGDRLGLTKAVISRHVANAEAAGWLRSGPSPTSRRERALTLTAAGRAVVTRGRRVQNRMESAGRDRLTATELERTVRTLTTLCEVLDEQDRA